MKLDWHKGRHIEPLYTLSEIAEKLGIEYKTLKNYVCRLHNKTPSPKPVINIPGKNLYRLSEFKVWFKQFLEERTK